MKVYFIFVMVIFFGAENIFALDARGEVVEENKVVQISAGDNHTCALLSNGGIRCWGADGNGQRTVPQDLKSAVQVSAGGAHTCALLVDQSVRCWGSNSDQINVPIDLEPVAQISTGSSHTCVLLMSGRVKCWGMNSSNQSSVPKDLALVVQVSASHYHTCAVLIDGSVKCWGDYYYSPITLQQEVSATENTPQKKRTLWQRIFK